MKNVKVVYQVPYISSNLHPAEVVQMFTLVWNTGSCPCSKFING